MVLGIEKIRTAISRALTDTVYINGTVKIPVYDLFPIQAVGEYIHIGDTTSGTIGAKGENLLSYTQQIRCIYEYNMQSSGSRAQLDTITSQVFTIMMGFTEGQISGFYLVEMELQSATTTELVGENGRRLAINDLRFNLKLQEI